MFISVNIRSIAKLANFTVFASLYRVFCVKKGRTVYVLICSCQAVCPQLNFLFISDCVFLYAVQGMGLSTFLSVFDALRKEAPGASSTVAVSPSYSIVFM